MNEDTNARLAALSMESGRLPVGEWLARARGLCGLAPDQARQALARLTAGGVLEFRYELGTSFVEPAFSGPVRIGRRLVLAPAGCAPPEPGDLVVHQTEGQAFGTGRHPTTRLVLAALEGLADRDPAAFSRARVLDLGCGSGVLALFAARLGAAAVTGLDTDPAALFEARQNAAANGLDGIAFSDTPAEEVGGPFEVTLANLRAPTLVGLAPVFARLLAPAGVLVVSGLRPDEIEAVTGAAAFAGLAEQHRDTLGGWAGLTLARPGSP